MRDTRLRETKRVDLRLKTETRAAYECPKRQVQLGEQRDSPAHQWITQVARGELEKEAVLMEDSDFLLLPDTHKRNDWRTGEARVVNLLIVFKDLSLHTIRDLRAEHLPVLHRIQTDVLERVEVLAGVPAAELYCYFNYQPSNPLLLHMHVSWPLPANRDSTRHHLLHTVCFNLGLHGEYYRDCPLATTVSRRIECEADGQGI